MSTKIYGGLIATDQNPFTIHSRIKKVVNPLLQEKFEAAVPTQGGMTWAEAYLDVNWNSPRYRAFGEQPIRIGPSGVPGYEVRSDLYKLVKLLFGDMTHTFSSLDFGYNGVILPNGRGLRHRPLVLLFSERTGDEYRDALISAGVVEEYHYQNQAGRPDDISAEDWEERRLAWDKLQVPSEDGLKFDMPSEFEVAWKHG